MGVFLFFGNKSFSTYNTFNKILLRTNARNVYRIEMNQGVRSSN